MEKIQYGYEFTTNNADEAALEHIESVILVALRMRKHTVGHVVDLAQLQDDCRSIGYSSREFSSGFVRLLMRRFLQPYGDFSFSLSEHGFNAGEKALFSRVRKNEVCESQSGMSKATDAAVCT